MLFNIWETANISSVRRLFGSSLNASLTADDFSRFWYGLSSVIWPPKTQKYCYSLQMCLTLAKMLYDKMVEWDLSGKNLIYKEEINCIT